MDEGAGIDEEAVVDGWLKDRLRSAAQAATGGVVIDDPRVESVVTFDGSVARSGDPDGVAAAVSQRFWPRRSVRSVVGVAAAAVLLAVGGLVWGGTREQTRQVVGTSPSDGWPSVEEPVSTDPTTSADPASESTAPEVVADALARTLGTSWVAERIETGISGGQPFTWAWDVTYQPPDPAAGKPSPAIAWTPRDAPEPRLVSLLSGSGDETVYASCPVGLPEPQWICPEGDWMSTGTAAWPRAGQEASLTGLLGVDSGTARQLRDPSEYSVEVTAEMCARPFGGEARQVGEQAETCPVATLEVVDGHVVSMRLSYPGSASEEPVVRWSYVSFGTAPPLDSPPTEDVVRPGSQASEPGGSEPGG